MLSQARAGMLAGLWAATLICLYDLAAVRPAALPWSAPWSFLLEVVEIGLFFYAFPFVLFLGAAGALLGALRRSSPVLPVAAATAAALVAAAVATLEAGGRSRWMSASWALTMLVLGSACLLAGWTAGSAWALVCWMLARRLRRSGDVE